MKNAKLMKYLVVILLVVGLAYFVVPKMTKKNLLTQPGTEAPVAPESEASIPAGDNVSIFGTLEKIEGNAVTLTYNDEKTSATASATFLVTKETVIRSGSVTPLFYFLTPVPVESKQITKNDLKLQDRVWIMIKKSDSESLDKPVEAVAINVNKGPFYSLVKITKVEGNTLKVESLGSIAAGETASYAVTVDENTEMIRLKEGSSAKVPTKDDYDQLTMDDLEVEMQANIYTEKELSLGGGRALQVIVRREKDNLPSVTKNE